MERGISVKSERPSSKSKKTMKDALRPSLMKKTQSDIEQIIPSQPTDTPVTFVPQTVAEFFFADEQGNLPMFLDMQEVDILYNDYIRVMSCMHERLRAVYN